MEQKTFRIISFCLFCSSFLPIYKIATISKGNFIAGPVILYLFCIPLLLLSFFLTLYIIIKKSAKPNLNKIRFGILFLVTLTFYYLWYIYSTGVT